MVVAILLATLSLWQSHHRHTTPYIVRSSPAIDVTAKLDRIPFAAQRHIAQSAVADQVVKLQAFWLRAVCAQHVGCDREMEAISWEVLELGAPR